MSAAFFRMDTMRAVEDIIQRDVMNAPMGDTQLFYHLATQGKVAYIRERMLTYRQHGSSFSAYDNVEKAKRFKQRSLDAHVRMANNNNHPEWAEEFRKLAEEELSTITPSSMTLPRLIRQKITNLKRFIRGDYANFRKYLALSPAERVRMFAES